MSTKSKNIILRMHPLYRALISLGFAAITYLFTIKLKVNLVLQIMLLWDVFAFCYIITCWIVFFKRPPEEIKRIATEDDGSRLFVFVIVLISAFGSMFTVLLLMLSKEAATSEKIYLPVAIAGMLLSWFMVHTSFAFHYAHLYYDDDISDTKQKIGGLEFPKEDKPDYLDFAYFSFVIGMTFQVSDVEISSKIIRRVTLLHSLLSFGLNTFVVALTINIIAGLTG
jgi:uncharacterized membrane protein